MSEIEKMMQNTNVKKHWNSTPYGGVEEYYPQFTAEKQIELIKWAARREPKVEIGYSSVCGYWVENQTDTRYYFGDQFDSALASLINSLWQDLTEEEKQQVKGILE